MNSENDIARREAEADARLAKLDDRDQAVVRDVLKQHPKLALAKALDMLEAAGM
jgi:FixJ family two-component response regulator